MSRYIDADLLQEDFKADHGGKRSLMIDTQPTADVRENVHGEWIADELTGWLCSNCGEHIVLNVKMHGNYCPNCGADMKGDNNERK